MDRQTLHKVQDPFLPARASRRSAWASRCSRPPPRPAGGDFRITSRPGRGTRVRARLQKSHLDCPPLGDLEATLLSLLVSLEGVDLRFSYRNDRGEFSLAGDDVRAQAGGLHFSHPEVYRFLKDYIHEGLGSLLAAGAITPPGAAAAIVPPMGCMLQCPP